MPQSHKRKDVQHHHSTTNIPVKQRTTGHTFWAILCAVFGLLIALFAAGTNYIALLIGALAGGAIGYFIGTKMEEDVSKK
jgi:uncharacterized membrane protein YfcA